MVYDTHYGADLLQLTHRKLYLPNYSVSNTERLLSCLCAESVDNGNPVCSKKNKAL